MIAVLENGRLRKILEGANLPQVAWWLLIASGSLIVILGGILGLPVDWSVPDPIRWLARGLLASAFVLGVIASISGHSIASIAEFARARLEKYSVGIQLVAVGLSMAIALAIASAVGFSLVRETSGSDLASRSFPDVVHLPNGSVPSNLALTPRGVWVGDANQPTVTFVGKDGASRQYLIPGGRVPDSKVSGQGVSAIASDSAGNVWVLDGASPAIVQGFSSNGTPLRRISVGNSYTLAIDKSGMAWAAGSSNGAGGAIVYAIDLRTGHVSKQTVFAKSPVSAVAVSLDPEGRAWILAAITDEKVAVRSGKSHIPLQYYRAGMLSRDAPLKEVPIRWPTATIPSFGNLSFAVDESSNLWIGSLGNIARVSSAGEVIRYPLYADMDVEQLDVLSPTRILFSAQQGIEKSPDRWTIIGSFDPQNMKKFPSIKKLPAEIGQFVPLAGGDRVISGQPKRHELITFTAEPARLTKFSNKSPARLKRIVAQYFRSLSALRTSNLSNKEIVIAERDKDRRIARDLIQSISFSPESLGDQVTQLVELIRQHLDRIVREYSSVGLVKARNPADLPGGAIAAAVLRSDASISLAELYELLTSQSLTPDGLLTWTPCKVDDVCIGI